MAWRKSHLEVYPSVDLVVNARAALSGAEYHLGQIRDQASRMQKVPSYQANAGILHWHLRAFFWELVASMETTRLALQRVSGSRRSSELAELDRTLDEDWWKEVEEWRNFAHRAFLFLQGEFHPDNKLNFLFLPPLTPSGPQHMVPGRLEYYLEQARQLQARVLP